MKIAAGHSDWATARVVVQTRDGGRLDASGIEFDAKKAADDENQTDESNEARQNRQHSDHTHGNSSMR
jgi:hypothetical protein